MEDPGTFEPGRELLKGEELDGEAPTPKLVEPGPEELGLEAPVLCKEGLPGPIPLAPNLEGLLGCDGDPDPDEVPGANDEGAEKPVR